MPLPLRSPTREANASRYSPTSSATSVAWAAAGPAGGRPVAPYNVLDWKAPATLSTWRLPSQ
ncbi:hypothetical protein [Hymenobacter rubripertinctus]|uniref:hypothetical protein n=1 Tax=Hymenobacter rubripertinctus TaxID=2029981 RepID=UPI0011C41E57|nr:hypothetical protein [Hymenobacter rubripertinctus]